VPGMKPLSFTTCQGTGSVPSARNSLTPPSPAPSSCGQPYKRRQLARELADEESGGSSDGNGVPDSAPGLLISITKFPPSSYDPDTSLDHINRPRSPGHHCTGSGREEEPGLEIREVHNEENQIGAIKPDNPRVVAAELKPKDGLPPPMPTRTVREKLSQSGWTL
jgi:hypothetical protein